MKTFIDLTECPKGHALRVNRMYSSAGFKVATRCPTCRKTYDLQVPDAQDCRVARPLKERDIEAQLVKRVGELGGEVRKVKWIGRVGAPDRLVMLPPRCPRLVDGKVIDHNGPIWVELKAPGKAATFPRNAHERAQHREHERMRRVGQRVEVVDSFEQIEELLR